MVDILDGLASARRAFLAANLEPPSAIHLASHHEGIRFLSSIRQSCTWVVNVGDPNLGMPRRMADGTYWMEVEVMEMKIRWPANRVGMPDGSWKFV